MMLTVATLFAGVGGSTLGAIAAGYRPIWAIEKNSAIANIYRQNIGTCYELDVLEITHCDLESPDLLLISPPCCSFSGNNVGGAESEDDVNLAKAIINIIQDLKPQNIAIENVPKYSNSVSFRLLEWWLVDNTGYQMHVNIIKADHHGVPQTRHRMVARFSHCGMQPIADVVKATGWADLLKNTAMGRQTELTCAQYRAWKMAGEPTDCIIQRVAYHGTPRLWLPSQNIGTVGAHWADDGKGGGHDRQALTIMRDGTSHWLTIEQLALLSGMPPDYKWSGSYRLDWRGLGNIMHPSVSEVVCRSFKQC